MGLIGPSLKGQQNGLTWHKSKHGALKNSYHNTSLRKLTTDVKAVGVTAPLSLDPPPGFICGLSNLVSSQVVVIGINIITRTSDKCFALLIRSDEHGPKAKTLDLCTVQELQLEVSATGGVWPQFTV